MTVDQLIEAPTFDAAVREAFQSLGGRATLSDTLDEVYRRHEELFAAAAHSALKGKVRKALTHHDGGRLPFAASVGDVYLARRLFSVDDYFVVTARYCRKRDEMGDVADRIADECADRYGVRPPTTAAA